MNARRRGFTLIELLVVLTLLAMTASIAVLSIPKAAKREDPYDSLRVARRRAIDRGIRTMTHVVLDGETHTVIARPDGSVIADSTLSVDRMTGVPERHATTR